MDKLSNVGKYKYFYNKASIIIKFVLWKDKDTKIALNNCTNWEWASKICELREYARESYGDGKS